MTGRDARRLAERAHGDEPDRYGVPVLDHVRRVAAAVPREAQVVAWLHEVFEYTATSAQDLRSAGVGEDELAVLELLTRDADADPRAYAAHIDQLVAAPGERGRLARVIKRADLHDRLCHQADGTAPAVARPAYGDALARLEATRLADDDAHPAVAEADESSPAPSAH